MATFSGIKRRAGAIGAAVLVVACTAAVSGCGSSSGSVSKATVQSWVDHWCAINYGEGRSAVQAVMGPPTATITAKTGIDQDQWRAYQYDFTAFYTSRMEIPESQQTVRQLEADPTGQLPAADKALIHCALTRGAPGVTFPGAP